MAQIRPDVKKNFLGIDSDHSNDLFPPNNLLDALNVRLHDNSTGGKLNVTNTQGNMLVDTASIASDGINYLTIGCFEQQSMGKMYYFNHHLTGTNDGIYELDMNTLAIVIVLQGPILNFSTAVIGSVNVIDNKMILFSDNVNPPRLIDIALAKQGYYTTPQSIMLIKAQPQYVPGYADLDYTQNGNPVSAAPTYISNSLINANNLKKQLFQIKYRYQYEDNLHSAWSGASRTPLPLNENSNIVNTVNTNNNGIKFTFFTGNRYVRKIDFAYSADGLNWAIFKTADKVLDSIPDNTIWGQAQYTSSLTPYPDDKFVFFNNNIGTPVPIIDTSSNFDDVPFTVGASSVANGNTILLGNVTKGRPNLNNDVDSNGNPITMNINLSTTNLIKVATQPFFAYLALQYPLAYGANQENARVYQIALSGTPLVGDNINMTFANGTNLYAYNYIVVVGDTLTTVIARLIILLGQGAYVSTLNPNSFFYILGANGNGIYLEGVAVTASQGSIMGFSKLPNVILSAASQLIYKSAPRYKDSNRYVFVLSYKDEFGRPGSAQQDTSFKLSGYNSTINTPSLYATGGSLCAINWNIYHNPPAWAKYYSWGRSTRLKDQGFVQWFTNKIEPSDNNKSEIKVFIDGIRLSGIGSPTKNLDNTVSANNGTLPNSIIKYQFSVGDRISFIKTYNQNNIADTAFGFCPFFDTEITSFIQNPTKTYAQSGFTDTGIIVLGGTLFQTDITTINTVDVIGKFLVAGGFTKRINYVVTTSNFLAQFPGHVGFVLDSATQNMHVDSFEILEFGDVITCSAPPYTVTNVSLVELYTPRKPATGVQDTYYEFGERYDIINGQHSVTSGQFTRGDIYQKARSMAFYGGYIYPQDNYLNQYPKLPTALEIVTDPNYNDTYVSNKSDNGRPMAEDPNSALVNYYTQINFSQSYFSNTTINGLATFYYQNFKEYDRNYQSIQYILVKGQKAIIFQELRTGFIPINQQITLAGDGKTSLQLSQTLLNNINYYEYAGGIGKNPESIEIGLTGEYFIDYKNSNICRLSNDGVVSISDNLANTLFINQFAKYKAIGIPPKVYTSYDRNRDSLIIAFSPASDGSTLTVEFHDGSEQETKRWTSRFSYAPDYMGSAFTDVYSWKNGLAYKHGVLVDSKGVGIYNNFYGVQYPSQLRMVFNNQPEVNKSFMNVAVQSDSIWTWDNIVTTSNQTSRLPAAAFNLDDGYNKSEDIYYADLLCDTSNGGSLVDGNDLKGNKLFATLTSTSTVKTSLFSVTLNSIYSPNSGY